FADEIGHDRQSVRCEAADVTVGAQHQLLDLWRQTVDHPTQHRLSANILQRLVAAAHARAVSAGEDDPGVRPEALFFRSHGLYSAAAIRDEGGGIVRPSVRASSI